MSSPHIKHITPNLATFSVPFSRGPLSFGGRSTAIKLRDGSVFFTATHPMTEDTKSTLDAMGPVKYIVALDAEHTMYTKDFHAAYPEAKLIGPEPVLSSKKELPWSGVYGRDAEPLGVELAASKEIQAFYFHGHANKDIAFFHADSKTLIQADLLFNLPAKEQYASCPDKLNSFPISLFANGLNPKGRSHQFLLTMVTKDKANMAEGAKAVDAWDFERIVPCHGDMIETGGKQAWRDTFRKFL